MCVRWVVIVACPFLACLVLAGMPVVAHFSG